VVRRRSVVAHEDGGAGVARVTGDAENDERRGPRYTFRPPPPVGTDHQKGAFRRAGSTNDLMFM
jgi:hypothetical protein